jgi:hypothetical protein
MWGELGGGTWAGIYAAVRKMPARTRHARCPNSDIENLESNHRRVSLSHRKITRK